MVVYVNIVCYKCKKNDRPIVNIPIVGKGFLIGNIYACEECSKLINEVGGAILLSCSFKKDK